MSGSPNKRLKRLLKEADPEGLSPEDRRFVEFYVQHFNGPRALRETFGNPPGRSLNKIISRPEVIAAIQRRREETSERFKLSKEWIIEQLLYKSGARKRDLFDDEGNLLAVQDWPDWVDAAVSSIDFEDLYEKRDGKRVKVGKLVKCRFYNTNESDALLMRHLGIDHMPSAEGRDRLHELVEVFKSGPVPKQIESPKEKK